MNFKVNHYFWRENVDKEPIKTVYAGEHGKSCLRQFKMSFVLHLIG